MRIISMKKVIYSLMMLAGLAMTSCEKEDIGNTATESLAGEWYVTADFADAEGNVVYEDPYDAGHFMVNTYNTASNVPTEMWVDDLGNFRTFKLKVNCDVQQLAFASNDTVSNAYYDCGVIIEEGKILPGAATTPSGMPADSIVFFVQFTNDDASFQEFFGYTRYKISGYRYTGLTNDD